MESRKYTQWPQNDSECHKAKGSPNMWNCYPRVSNFTPFSSTIARFPDKSGFWFLHRLQCWIWNFEKKSLKIQTQTFKKKKKNETTETQNFNNPQRSFVTTIGKKIQDQFENIWLRFVGVAFWNIHSHWVPCSHKNKKKKWLKFKFSKFQKTQK